MALPLPKVVPDVGPGGPLVTALGGMNALYDAIQQAKYDAVKAQYAPFTIPAQALSQATYSQLMGPQYIAKLMGNKDIVANSPELRNPNTARQLYQAGMGAGGGMGNASQPEMNANGATGNPLLDLVMKNAQTASQSSRSPLAAFVDTVKNAFNLGDKTPAPESAQNALLMNQPNLSQQDRNAIGSMQPGQAYTIQGNQNPPMQGTNANAGYSYQPNGNNTVASPQEINMVANNNNPQQDNYAKNAATYAGIVKAGEELGTERGKAIADLGKQQQNLSDSGVILDRLISTVQSPEFQTMRSQIPFFQDKQLQVLAKIGTPEQQRMIGDFLSTAQAFVASTVNSFKGKALEKEFNLANKMKINENDTVGVAEGKLRALKTIKEISETKNDMIIDLMTNQNMDQGKAVKLTNKLVNTKLIENQVNGLLSTKPTDEDIAYMANKYKTTPDDIRKRLKAKGIS